MFNIAEPKCEVRFERGLNLITVIATFRMNNSHKRRGARVVESGGLENR